MATSLSKALSYYMMDAYDRDCTNYTTDWRNSSSYAGNTKEIMHTHGYIKRRTAGLTAVLS
ncbi:MAG: hypothetical protein NVSMB44_36320 [Ktedonobacteraceae bacterium]